MGEKKRGRPPLPDKDRRVRLVGVRFTDADYRRLERAARAAGLASVTEWVRDSANYRSRETLRKS